MNCTNCKDGFLKPEKIDDLFPAHTCDSCGGNWILIEEYAIWKANNPDHVFSSHSTTQEFKSPEPKKALICPVSGSIMQKFRITSNSEHKINYSAKVGGIWLDKGEWDYLKSEGLAGSLNTVLTEHKQNEIMQDTAKEHFSEIYQDRFGKEAYQKIIEIREWLDKHEQKQDLLAYLVAEDPYSANR